MLSVLANRTYRHLFAAQVIALVGTGLMTVALGLLAFKLAGAKAGTVLGTALAIKMIAYVTLAPIAGSLASYLPRRPFLVAMDLIRAAVALALPFVDQIWQIYLLIFLLQAASAAFTPTFQATIPDILPNESDYTKALSMSRLAYDLENLLSPTLAAVLLTVIAFNTLFAFTVIGFLCSAVLVLSVQLPVVLKAGVQQSFAKKTTGGLRIYLATPRLRGLLALNLAVAAAGAMVIVNTVVIIRAMLERPESDVAIALACFGAGSMLAALALPRMLDRFADRTVMLSAGAALAGLMFAAAIALRGEKSLVWLATLILWLLMGIFYSAVQTPTGRLLRRSSQPADRPALFAAQFALSHACWLLTYPLAGWFGNALGLSTTALILAGLTMVGVLSARLAWPADDPDVLAHDHSELEPVGAHLKDGEPRRHAHAFVIDEHHRHWPNKT